MDRKVGLPEPGQPMGYAPAPPLAWFERVWIELGLDMGLIRKRDDPANNVQREKFLEAYEKDLKTGNKSVKSELHRVHSCPNEPIATKKMKKAEARQAPHSV